MADHRCPCGRTDEHAPCPGGWGPVPERDWSWVKSNEFSELCKRATCEATDATHFHRPQDAHSGPTDAATAGMALDGLSLSAGPTCAVCGRGTSGLLEVVPVCMEHVAYGEVEQHISRLHDALRRWVVAGEFFRRPSSEGTTAEFDAHITEHIAATEALEALARALPAAALAGGE